MQLNVNEKCTFRAFYLRKIFLVMKLTGILLTVACLQVSARAFSQTISFSKKNVSLNKVFEVIQRQSGYLFFYNNVIISQAGKTDVNLEHASITEALDQALKDKPLTYTILDKYIVVSRKEPANNDLILDAAADTAIKVYGRVTGPDNQALPGVTVRIKGGTTGVTTDNNGLFNLDAPTGSVLVFSYIGYQDMTLPVNGKQVMNVSMKPSTTGLNQLVVVGYGTQNKLTTAGAITTIGSRQIEQQVTNNVAQALEGTVAGLQTFRQSGDPASGYTSILRGLSSISIPASPLILIDGVPGSFNDVTPDQVESITVLKDATTAGIYGSSSAGGVILITTKNGSGKPKLTINYTVGINNFVHLIKELRGNDFMRLQNEALVNGGYLPYWTQQQIDSVGAGTDWGKAVTRTGIRHELNINYSGGSKAFNYLISGNYLHEDGAVLSNWYERMITRVKLNSQTTRWLNLGMNLEGSFAHGDAGASVIGAGSYTPNIPESKGVPDLSYPGTVNYVSVGVNPVQALQDSIRGYSNHNPTYSFNAFFTPEIIFSRHLQFNSIMNAGFGFTYQKDYYGSYTVYDASHTVLLGQRTQANTAAYAAASYIWNIGIQNYLTFSDTIHNIHALNIVAGNREYKIDEGANISAVNSGYSNNLLQNINNGTARNAGAGSDNTPSTKRSFFGRATYSYKEKYILEGTLSYDGSDRFGSNNKYGLFPAAAAAWRISEEPFLKNAGWINNLKLRASYGVLGNDGIPQFLYYQTISESNAYAFGSPNYVGALGAFPTSIANPNIKWESTATFDLGIDFYLLTNWNMVVDFYNRNTSNMLFDAPVSLTTGFTNEYLNIGSLNNKGIEISVGYQRHWSDWGINANLTFSHNTNKVTKLFNGLTTYPYGPTDAQAFVVGQPSTLIYGIKVRGIYQNAAELAKYPRKGAQIGDYIFQDLNGDSLISSSDLQTLGNSFPKIMTGLNIGASWRNIDLTIGMSGEFDYNIVNGAYNDQVTQYNFFYLNANERWLAYYNNRWRGPSTSNTMPALKANDFNNSVLGVRSTDLRNGNFVRIQNIQVGYTFSRSILDKIKMKGLRVDATVSNPLLISSYYGYDPETGGYPMMRTISLGLNTNF